MAHAEKVFKVRNGKKTTKYTWRARYKRPDGSWGSEPGFPTRKLAEEDLPERVKEKLLDAFRHWRHGS